MHSDLTYVLPVYNAQGWLEGHIAELCEVMPELSPRVRIVVVDDGSTDATPEVLDELSRRYPQVEITRNARRQGRARALRTGLERADSNYVILGSDTWLADPHDFNKLWSLRYRCDAVSARPKPTGKLNWLGKLSSSWTSLAESRVILAPWALVQRSLQRGTDWLEQLWAADCNWNEIEIRQRMMPGVMAASGVAMPGIMMPDSAMPTAESSPQEPQTITTHSKPEKRRGPSYLSKLRNFALGE